MDVLNIVNEVYCQFSRSCATPRSLIFLYSKLALDL